MIPLQDIKVKYINTAVGVLDNWAFLYEGWLTLGDSIGARFYISCEDYLKTLMRLVERPATEGTIIMYSSKNDKPLGYTVLMNNSETSLRTCLIYVGYSNGKCPSAAQTSMAVVERWAKANGYKEIHAQSQRMNGAAQRLFERKLGFHPASIIYKKEL